LVANERGKCEQNMQMQRKKKVLMECLEPDREREKEGGGDLREN
jgi:hypothetical protein